MSWSWKDYEKEFGPRPKPAARRKEIEPPAAPQGASEEPSDAPEESAADDDSDDSDGVAIVLDDALYGELIPHAEARNITVGALVALLLRAELDGDLIDTTLEGEFPDAAHGSASDQRPSVDDGSEASDRRANGEDQ